MTLVASVPVIVFALESVVSGLVFCLVTGYPYWLWFTFDTTQVRVRARVRVGARARVRVTGSGSPTQSPSKALPPLVTRNGTG